MSKLYSDKVKGAQIRSRIKWVEEGEKKPTKFFLGLEKARQARKNITALKDNKGKLIKEQSKILELEREYYITLYETKNLDPIKIEEYNEATNIENKLSRDESNGRINHRGMFKICISNEIKQSTWN